MHGDYGQARLPLAAVLWAGGASIALAASPAPAEGENGMVVTAQHLATDVGVEVLKAGGNAVDAAVAVGYALAVTYPTAGNLGGGGFMTIRLADGTTTFLDFRERAPLAATKNMYLDDEGDPVPGASTDTYLAVGVPGSVAGFETAREKYGTMPREELIAPAMRLARDGFVLEPGDVASFADGNDMLAQDPAAAKIFLKDGQPLPLGATLVQADLAQRPSPRSRRAGADAFYKGETADLIVKASEANGGILAKADFEDYKVRELEPVECNYRGYDIVSSPPPSSGGLIICEILNILEGYPISYLGYGSAETTRLMVEAMRHAYVDRNTALGDPDFVENPVAKLTSDAYAEEIRAEIDPYRAGVSADLTPEGFGESTETTHYSIIDKDGNAVAVTYTLNGSFGTGKVAEGTGILLNNEMDDFTDEAGRAEPLRAGAGRGQRHRAGQVAAVVDEPDDRLEGRQALHGDRQPRRVADHHHHARGDHERDRPRHGPAGGDRRAAHPPPVAAGPGLHRAARAVARHAAHPRGRGLRRRHRPGLDDLGRGGRHPRRRPRPARDRGRHRPALHRRDRQPRDGGVGEGVLTRGLRAIGVSARGPRGALQGFRGSAVQPRI